MEHKLDAIVKRHNKKVQVALSHPPCRYIVDIRRFPEEYPWGTVLSWIQARTDALDQYHHCTALSDGGELPADRGADLGFFGGRAVLGYAREGIAGVHRIVDRIAAARQGKGAAR